jgi:DNA-binding transcriptional MerR regulator
MDQGFKIGEFAQRLGINAKTVRYYEELGLLAAPQRNASGYRLYTLADEDRLRFVLGAKALGLSLAEIGEIVAAWAGGSQPCGHVSRLLSQKLQELDHRIAELTRFRDDLAAYKARVDLEGESDDVPCKHVKGVEEGRWAVPLPHIPDHMRPGGKG